MFEKRAHVVLAILIITMPIFAGGFYYKLLRNDLGVTNPPPPIILRKMPTVNQEETQKIQDDLLEARVRLALLNSLNTKEVFRNPLNKNQFVFVTKNVGGGINNTYVGVYDFTKDKDYKKNNDVNLSASNTYSYIYNEKFSEQEVMYAVGMDGSKLILWETSTDNSPGPCFNTLLEKNLTSIDITAVKPIRKQYVVPPAKITEAQKEVAACEAGL